MNLRSYILLTAFVCAFSFAGVAQSDDCPCCSKSYDQFDFWLGKWEVKNKDGRVVGQSSIQKLESNCLVSEKWEGNNNFSGRSYNYYNPETDTWNQLWVSNNGEILKLEGKAETDKMILTGGLISDPEGNYKNQIVWTAREDGTVTQEWLLLSEENEVIKNLFFGIYHRKN